MKKQQRKSLQSSDRLVGGGIYLPSQKYITRTIGLVLLLLTVLLIGIATRADAGERPANTGQQIELGGVPHHSGHRLQVQTVCSP